MAGLVSSVGFSLACHFVMTAYTDTGILLRRALDLTGLCITVRCPHFVEQIPWHEVCYFFISGAETAMPKHIINCISAWQV